jgi:hypothetical protein
LTYRDNLIIFVAEYQPNKSNYRSDLTDMKSRIVFTLLAVAIITGFGFVIDKSEQPTTSETMSCFYIDIYAYDISSQGDVYYEISGDNNEWTSGYFDPEDNPPQVHYCAPYSSWYGEIRIYCEYYGTEGCIRYKTVRDTDYFTGPNTYDFVFEWPWAVGDCDE